MLPISYIREAIGAERFDNAIEAARKARQSREPVIRINRVSMLFGETENKGPTIEQGRAILKLSNKFKFNLPKIQELTKR
jgi:hypothetical protein